MKPCRRPISAIYSRQRGLAQGQLDSRLADQNVRFVWDEDNARKIIIEGETCNSVVLRIEPGPPGNLTRTDSYYPGWEVTTPGVTRLPPKLQTFSVPAEVTRVVLRYRPVHLSATLALSATTLGVLAVGALGLVLIRKSQAAPNGSLNYLPGSSKRTKSNSLSLHHPSCQQRQTPASNFFRPQGRVVVRAFSQASRQSVWRNQWGVHRG